MFYEEITIEQGLSYISFWPLRILYNSTFILMANLWKQILSLLRGFTVVSFGQLGIICDPDINLQKSQNELNGHKGEENRNYTIVKYRETITAATRH